MSQHPHHFTIIATMMMMLLALAAIAAISSTHIFRRQQRRKLQELAAIMEGECTNSILESGQQRSKGSYLCYTTTTTNINEVIYKFGLDSNNELAYYMN